MCHILQNHQSTMSNHYQLHQLEEFHHFQVFIKHLRIHNMIYSYCLQKLDDLTVRQYQCRSMLILLTLGTLMYRLGLLHMLPR